MQEQGLQVQRALQERPQWTPLHMGSKYRGYEHEPWRCLVTSPARSLGQSHSPEAAALQRAIISRMRISW